MTQYAAFSLLSQSMDKYTGVQQLQANNNLSPMNEAASTSTESDLSMQSL